MSAAFTASKRPPAHPATKPCVFLENDPRHYKETFKATKNIRHLGSDSTLFHHAENSPSRPKSSVGYIP